ncbi:MAG: hypothetical protein FWC67_04670 [Defluviitaleaceae bacterium]|nr:hypothetical protein [Defluviitaleaceae bacterium]
MAADRELKTFQEEKLFDILKIMKTTDEKKRNELLVSMFVRAQSGMTKEEIAEVEKRVAIAMEAQ